MICRAIKRLRAKDGQLCICSGSGDREHESGLRGENISHVKCTMRVTLRGVPWTNGRNLSARKTASGTLARILRFRLRRSRTSRWTETQCLRARPGFDIV
jgi:hypothetical protein